MGAVHCVCTSVHIRSNLTDAEKLAYLRHALKNGSTKSVVEGLSRSGESLRWSHHLFENSIQLTSLDIPGSCPCDIPSYKDGSGKKLRRLHDTAQQHLRALKALGHDPSGLFITSLLEIKT